MMSERPPYKLAPDRYDWTILDEIESHGRPFPSLRDQWLERQRKAFEDLYRDAECLGISAAQAKIIIRQVLDQYQTKPDAFWPEGITVVKRNLLTFANNNPHLCDPQGLQ